MQKLFFLISLLIFVNCVTDKEINEKCQKLPSVSSDMSSILHFFKKFDDLKLYDYDYLKKINPIKKKNINLLTRDEILTYITFIIRADRFSGSVANSELLSKIPILARRLKLITKS